MKKVELLQLVDQLSGTPVGHEYEMAVFKAGRELIRQATELAELTNRLHDANQSVGNLEANISALKGQKPVFYINQDSLSAFKDGAKGWGTVWTVKHGDYKVPLYPAPGAQPYDQQALELCEACGWKAIIPGERCLVCERNDALAAGEQPSDAIDAARYRWLRDPCSDLSNCYYSRGDFGRGLKNTTMLDEVIDAAKEDGK